MNRVSLNNNFKGVLLPTLALADNSEKAFIGQYEDCSQYSTIVINLHTQGNGQYQLGIQQSNDNTVDSTSTSETFQPEQVGAGQPIVIRMNYFRVFIGNSSETENLSVLMETNLLKTHITTNESKQSETQTVSVANFPEQPMDLHTERGNGNCYMATNEFTVNNVNFTPFYILFNPVNSGKRIFWYNINATKSGNDLRTYVGLRIRKISGFSGGTLSGKPTNLKFDSNKTSVVEQRTGSITSVNAEGFLDHFILTDTRFNRFIDYQEEFIEIPSGYGIVIEGRKRLSDGTTTNINTKCVCSFRYIEIDDPTTTFETEGDPITQP